MITYVTYQVHFKRHLESKMSAGILQQTLSGKSLAGLLLKRFLLRSMSNNSGGKAYNNNHLLKAMMKKTIQRIRTSWKAQLLQVRILALLHKNRI